jgi:hypothetical protein
MKKAYLILIFFLVFCLDDKDSNKPSDGLMLLLFQIYTWNIDYCPQPELIIEKGVSYPITLKEGELFWIDFHERRNQANDIPRRQYSLLVTKQEETDLQFKVKAFCFENDNDIVRREPMSITPTEIIYELFVNGKTDRHRQAFSLEWLSGSKEILIRQE